MTPAASFAEAARAFDPESVTVFEHDAEEQRLETLRRYPRERWPEMSLEDYAMGQSDHPDNFCRWIERQTDQMGSIRGGSSRKLIVYKHATKPGWYFSREHFQDEQEAWRAVRAGFIEAFDLAGEDRWADIEGIEALAPGPALVLKTLWAYFPDRLLPITSTQHLRHFLSVAGEDGIASDSALGAIQLNRALFAALRQHSELEELSTKALERFLYLRFNPLAGQLIKIAPGHQARFWDECLAGGFICVGWDEVGDLLRYESKEAFTSAFADVYRDKHPTQAKQTEKSNELWSLVDIADGERIVANRGTSEILGVGTVVPPGYVWDDSREEYKHTVRVDWDTSYAKTIPAQKRWTFKTILPLKAEVRDLILEGANRDSGPAPKEPIFAEIGSALERRGQAILYGPPGTGKSWTAGRFADWWLEEASSDSDRFKWITFHPSYSYEDFVEGFRPDEARHESVKLKLQSGIFKEFCKHAKEDQERKFLMVIDEINRANIAKVFGELITLMEQDKRGNQAELPYSKERFAVPPNVYVLGTMNTADRSIRLLDTALRRRFGFVELMPSPELLSGAQVEGLELDELLSRLNHRIARTAGREKQIGHSFFLDGGQPVTDPAEFTQIFRSEIVPMLQEYASDDFGELSEYLGPGLVDEENFALRVDVLGDPSRLVEALEEHLLGGPGTAP
jgi:5-methylcytosine-specific restriction protein B